MGQDLDQLSNEDLAALAATEIMGWRRKLVFTGLESGEAPIFWWQDTAETLIYNTTAWCPAAEGHEHQAFVVADKMFQDGWGWELSSPLPGEAVGPDNPYGMRFWKSPTNHASDDLEVFGGGETRGRAVVLAALKAKGDGG